MRIGIDATCWANPRGYGRFTRELVPVMAALSPADTFICFVDSRAAEKFDITRANVETRLVAVESPTTAAAADRNRAPSDMLRFTWAVAREHLDVFFSPSVYTYFPLPPGLKAVVTVHDAIADRFPELTLPGWRARTFWRLKVSLALYQATLVLTVSDFAADEIARVLKVPRRRIRVAIEAPADTYKAPVSCEEVAQLAARCGLPPGARWFDYVGGFNPHKNVDLLVRAHALVAREAGRDAPHLLLVGATDGDVFYGNAAHIRRTIEAEGTSSLVHWLGFLRDEEVRLVHAGAIALVMPSTCEGFGLPAVEAAACGTPVIATTESPLPQLLAGGGVFVAPGNVDQLARALRTLSSDEPARRAMGLCARARTLALSWESAAQVTLAALREAA